VTPRGLHPGPAPVQPWCRLRSLPLFAVRRADIETFARDYKRVDEVCGMLAGQGTEPAIPLVRRLAAALDADVRLTPRGDLGSAWFQTRAA
jgi:hypothetical protein